MKKFFKIFILCFILFIFGVKAHAAAFNSIGKAIDNTGLGHDSIISIVVKDMENGDAVFFKTCRYLSKSCLFFENIYNGGSS